MADEFYNTLNYEKQGGAEWVVGGKLTLASTGTTSTAANVGTANTGVTAVERGNDRNHTTILTISQAAAFASADNASLGAGYKIYDFPAGVVTVSSAYMSVGLTNAEHAAENPDVGIGTVIGSGAVAVLGGTATFENIITGQTASGCAGVPTVKTIVNQGLAIEVGDSHSVFLNAACAWANTAGTALNVDIAGTVVINWRFVA